MPIFELTNDSLTALKETKFADRGIRERFDLQRLLRLRIDAIEDGLYVLAEEYGNWDDSKRRIDLLCIDIQANLVVVELKRSEDGGHMDLQAIRYAAMVHLMTFEQAVEAHKKYLAILGRQEDPEAAILKFLGWEAVRLDEFAKEVRIILVSAEFSKEITSSVLWLNERELDIKCVRLRPYSLDSRVLLDIQQVIPLPEAADITIQIREKAAEVRRTSGNSPSDFTRYDLIVDGQLNPGLVKRKLILCVVRSLVAKGIKPVEIMKFITKGKWLRVEGECDSRQFADKALLKNASVDLSRYFTGSDELFVVDGATYALTKMFSIYDLPTLDGLLNTYHHFDIKYQKAAAELVES